MNNWKLALLRAVLVVTTLGSLSLLNALWFSPEFAITMYGGTELDELHRVLAVLFGAAIAGYIVSCLLALWRPLQFSALVMLLGLFHAIITAADIYLLANGIGNQGALVSQTIYDLLVTLALLALYPASTS